MLRLGMFLILCFVLISFAIDSVPEQIALVISAPTVLTTQIAVLSSLSLPSKVTAQEGISSTVLAVKRQTVSTQ